MDTPIRVQQAAHHGRYLTCVSWVFLLFFHAPLARPYAFSRPGSFLGLDTCTSFCLDGQGRATIQDHQPGEVQRLLRQDDVHAAGRAGAGAGGVGTSEGHPGVCLLSVASTALQNMPALKNLYSFGRG